VRAHTHTRTHTHAHTHTHTCTPLLTGTVRKAVKKESGEQVAVKSIAKRKLLIQVEVEDVRKEISILHHLVGHPALAQIFGVFEDKVSLA